MRNEIINADQSPMFWEAYKIANREARSLKPMKTFSSADMIANPWKRGYMSWGGPIPFGAVGFLSTCMTELMRNGQNAAGILLTLDSLVKIGIRRIVRFAN